MKFDKHLLTSWLQNTLTRVAKLNGSIIMLPAWHVRKYYAKRGGNDTSIVDLQP